MRGQSVGRGFGVAEMRWAGLVRKSFLEEEVPKLGLEGWKRTAEASRERMLF